MGRQVFRGLFWESGGYSRFDLGICQFDVFDKGEVSGGLDDRHADRGKSAGVSLLFM